MPNVIRIIDQAVEIGFIPNSQITSTNVQDAIEEIAPIEYVYTQAVPALTWSIVHNLNCFPSIVIVDSAGTLVNGRVEYVDENNINVNFGYAFSGKVYLHK